MLINMDLVLINWLRDGEYRLKTLRLLRLHPDIPSNISKNLQIHRSSLSRILNDLSSKGLIDKITSSSRTITYRITALGEDIIKEYDKKNGNKY
jgi:DNA-binding MarR family transcriptional regulator